MYSTSIAAFYAFTPLEEGSLGELQTRLRRFGTEKNMRGLVLLATEGINGTVCGGRDVVDEWKALINATFPSVTWNDSIANDHVFPRWLVKVRAEIVALEKPDSERLEGTHLTPAQWNDMMEKGNAVVIDTRNTYETAIGMFEGAIDPGIDSFNEFTAYSRTCPVPKDANVLLYCTGGIRCEKAVRSMKEAGFENVFQLQGGILSYLKECPDGKFNGECFVFDHRVAVNRHLRPSETYALCPHCGDPATQKFSCARCSGSFKMCVRCEKRRASPTCGKNCAYHFERTRAVTGARRP